MASVKRTGLVCPGHTRPVVDLAFASTPDGPLLLSGSKDNQPMIRNGSTGDWIGTLEGHKGAVWGVAFDSAGQRAATASADFSVKIWSATTGTELASLTHPHIAKAVDFSPDSSRLVTACNDKLLRIFDLATNAEVASLNGHSTGVRKALYISDSTIVSAAEDKNLTVWDARSGQAVLSKALPESITSLDLSRPRNLLLAAAGDSIIQFDTNTWEFTSHTAGAGLLAAALHPREPLAVWGGQDNLLRFGGWPALDVTEECRGHFGPIHTIRVSPDGEVVASGSEDGTIRLWQVHVGMEYGLWRPAEETPAS